MGAAPEAPSENLTKPDEKLKDLGFRVDPVFHQQFKIEAAIRGMSMRELLEAAFRSYCDNHPRR
jgi:predicted HicB family RNase H-like nuclease